MSLPAGFVVWLAFPLLRVPLHLGERALGRVHDMAPHAILHVLPNHQRPPLDFLRVGLREDGSPYGIEENAVFMFAADRTVALLRPSRIRVHFVPLEHGTEPTTYSAKTPAGETHSPPRHAAFHEEPQRDLFAISNMRVRGESWDGWFSGDLEDDATAHLDGVIEERFVEPA